MKRLRSRRRFLTSGVAIVLGLPLAGCSQRTEQRENAAQRTTVQMRDNLVFDPNTLTVSVGTNVSWVGGGTNRPDESVSSVEHTVTAYGQRIPNEASYFASGGFDSESAARAGYPRRGGLDPNERFAHTFDTPGSYEYFCIPHENYGMTGTITVVE